MAIQTLKVKLSILFLLFLLPFNLTCQDLRIEQVQDKRMVDFIKRIHYYKYLNIGEWNSVGVFFLSNPPGSAKIEGTGKISHDIGLLVCNDGEFPECNFFVVKNLYKPRLCSISPDALQRSILKFQYQQVFDTVLIDKELTLKVDLKRVEIVSDRKQD